MQYYTVTFIDDLDKVVLQVIGVKADTHTEAIEKCIKDLPKGTHIYDLDIKVSAPRNYPF